VSFRRDITKDSCQDQKTALLLTTAHSTNNNSELLAVSRVLDRQWSKLYNFHPFGCHASAESPFLATLAPKEESWFYFLFSCQEYQDTRLERRDDRIYSTCWLGNNIRKQELESTK
jgi:hypothetical protein